nr:penicillin-binding protein [Sphingomonadaceae bacterium]
MNEHATSIDDLLARASGVRDVDPSGPTPAPPIAPPSTNRQWPWIRRGAISVVVLLAALFAWLALTAPLSKSLKPIAPPRITLLASDGEPIAQNG